MRREERREKRGEEQISDGINVKGPKSGLPAQHQEEEETGAGGGEVKRTERCHDAAGVVGVRTLIMGCQTIMLIVYSALTPSVCLYVYSYRLQRQVAGSRFLIFASFFVLVVVVVAILLLSSPLSDERLSEERERERKRLSSAPSNRFTVGERDENCVSKGTLWWFTRRKLFIRPR